MIRPVAFGLNKQTAVSNTFQDLNALQSTAQENALIEFDTFVEKLKAAELDVLIIEDTPHPHTPDSIFPNNWISFHHDGTVVLYPMLAENRRLERRKDILNKLTEKFNVSTIRDLSHYEEQNIFLEGTGSLVLNRENKIAYACLSSRTNETVLNDFCRERSYSAITFRAYSQDVPIYHTNVMMCIGDKFAVICLDVISDLYERAQVQQSLINSGKEIIEISIEQMNQFAGNMLFLKNKKNKSILILSETAYLSLHPEQVNQLSYNAEFLYSPLNTIEKNGGGSARCMIAEVYLPLRK